MIRKRAPFNVLVSSAGRRVALLDLFRRALHELGLDGEVMAADASRLASAVHHADRAFAVPLCTSDAFVPEMLEICERADVKLVVPTIDDELPVLAEHRARFAERGTVIAVSSPETIAIGADKEGTHAWLEEHGFSTVRQTTAGKALAEPGDWPLPLIVKPRRGSASIGVGLARDRAELELAARADDLVVQTVAPGVEHSVDVLVDQRGSAVCAVPRKRLEVRSGEMSKGVTVRSPLLEELSQKLCEALPGAYGALTVQLFIDESEGLPRVIELNPRFGGGFPLSNEAGAQFPRWIVEEVAGRSSTASATSWRDGVVMLRYDQAVFVDASVAGL